MRTAAILPVKGFSRAKQRLGASIDDSLRLQLAGAMVADVLQALRETEEIERTIVVTGERTVAHAACAQGAVVLEDHAEEGQSAAAALGVHRALREGIERVLCVPGDCPALDPVELRELLAAPLAPARPGDDPDTIRGAGSTVTIVPDRHGSGTNGLLLSPPNAIEPSFGPDSCQRHRALALSAGIFPRIARPGSLLLDIDTGADLDELRSRLAGLSAQAPRTREVLGRHERTKTLPISTPA